MNMRSLKPALLGSLLASVALPLHATSVYTDPVGAVVSELEPGLHVVSGLFVKEKQFQGALSGINGVTLSVSNGDLSAYGGGDYFVEVVSGDLEGLMMDIVSSTADSITVESRFSSLLGDIDSGDSIAIRQHQTLEDLFASADFGSAASAVAIFYDVEGNETQLVNNSPSGDWADAFSGVPANPVVRPGMGFALFLGEASSMTSVGSVKVGRSLVELNGDFAPNIVGTLNPASGLTLASSNLSEAITADQDVVVFLGVDGSETQVVYSSASGNFIDAITSENLDSSEIGPGSGVFVFSGDSIYWDVPAAY
ncbi:MAG: hypothetical protein JJU00_07860 [Opitutales bacterium]|nr:hypothetical protein [Opitutales bacterium]